MVSWLAGGLTHSLAKRPSVSQPEREKGESNTDGPPRSTKNGAVRVARGRERGREEFRLSGQPASQTDRWTDRPINPSIHTYDLLYYTPLTYLFVSV